MRDHVVVIRNREDIALEIDEREERRRGANEDEEGWMEGEPAEVLEREPHEQLDKEANEAEERQSRNRRGPRKRVTQAEFYSYLRSIRGYFNNVLSAGSLTQQWIVDSYVKIEANRVKYIREHQAELRVVQYSGLMDFINNRAARENVEVGNIHVLPSTFIGSSRAMKQALARRYGNLRQVWQTYFFLCLRAIPSGKK